MKAHIGQRISAENKILLRDKPVWLQVSLGTEILVLNKNAGTVCSRKDDKGRTTIFRDLPKPAQGRWVSVGRLDIATTGLIVLTNNGKLANRMMHPSSGIDKEYAVRVNGRLTDEILQSLKKGAKVDGELLRFSDIRFFDGSGVNNWYHVVLMDGKNREVRNLFDFFGLSVSRLKRVRFGPILLPSSLKVGQHVYMDTNDTKSLCQFFEVEFGEAADNKASSRRYEAKRSLLIPYPGLKIN